MPNKTTVPLQPFWFWHLSGHAGQIQPDTSKQRDKENH